METFSFAMLKVNALAGTNHLLAGASQVAQLVKNLPVNAEDTRDVGFDPWVRKIPWKSKLQPTPVFLPGKSHGRQGWRSLVGCRL